MSEIICDLHIHTYYSDGRASPQELIEHAASQPLDLASRLGELALPVLVMTGDDDRIVPTAQSVRLSKEIPGARLVVVPNCGHIPQEEQPQAFLQAVGQFLSSMAHDGWVPNFKPETWRRAPT